MERVEDCVAEARDGGWSEGEGGSTMRFALIYAFYLRFYLVISYQISHDCRMCGKRDTPRRAGSRVTCESEYLSRPRARVHSEHALYCIVLVVVHFQMLQPDSRQALVQLALRPCHNVNPLPAQLARASYTASFAAAPAGMPYM